MHFNILKVDLAGRSQGSDIVTGIFVKSVILDSPAGRTLKLATGDRIVEVENVKYFPDKIFGSLLISKLF